jgi:hypothetical protein
LKEKLTMNNLPAKIDLDATSIWADVYGEESVLDSVEGSLRSLISQGLGGAGANGGSGMDPWFRVPGKLRVLAGLLPWAWPEHDWPRVWDTSDEEITEMQLRDLAGWGWRDYQVDAVRSLVKSPLGRGIAAVGTGGGKTRIAWGVAYVAGGDWLYVVHGRDLVRQADEAFRSFMKPLRLSQKLGWSLASYGWRSAPFGRGPGGEAAAGVIVDECHSVSAKTRAQGLASFRGGWRLGMSGSALDRTDARNPITVGLLGPMVANVSVSVLTGEGHLTPGVVRMVTLPDDE